jgi:hypothetical protein
MSAQTENMSHEDVQRNIDRLIAKHELLNGKMRRSGLILFGLMAMYLLIDRGALRYVDLGYFNLSDIDLIRLLLTPVFAAYYLYLVVTGFELSKVNGVLGMFSGEPNPLRHNPDIMSVHDVRSAILPYSFYKYFSDARWEVIPKWMRAVILVLFTIIMVVLFVPLVFIVHLLATQCYVNLGVLGWCSTIATIVLLLLTIAMQYVYFRVSLREHRARMNTDSSAIGQSAADK